MPRFVILTHDWPFPHYDFMLECGGSLRTWRMALEPDFLAISPHLAESLGDHRLAYLDYEGPVSGDRGQVRRWDAGKFEFTLDTAETIVVRLMGGRLVGAVSLTRMEGAAWAFRFQPESAPC